MEWIRLVPGYRIKLENTLTSNRLSIVNEILLMQISSNVVLLLACARDKCRELALARNTMMHTSDDKIIYVFVSVPTQINPK